MGTLGPMAAPPRTPAPPVDLPPLAPPPTTAERAAERIRESIFTGRFEPGRQLPEAALARALQVSRTTVREAFRLLMAEHLLAYEMHRGVTVRSLDAADVHDIYALRRTIEVASLDSLAGPGPAGPDPARPDLARPDLAGLAAAVEAGERAERERRWRDLGTEDLRFHARLVALRGSPRTDRIFRGLLTELRLGFLLVADEEALHRRFLPRHRELLALLAAGNHDRARAELLAYLGEAEVHVAAAVGG